MARRTRSPHPGVILIPPSGEHTAHRARYKDPDTERMVWERIDPVAVRTVEARRDWAIQKSRAIAKRRLELEGGAHRATGTNFDDAIKTYFDDHPNLRAKTLEAYRGAANKLTMWAARTGLKSADDLTGPRLVAFRAGIVKEPLRAHVTGKGTKRSPRPVTDKPRSPHTINRELRSVQTILEYLRRLGLLPRITSDNLSDGLHKLQTGSERLDYRKPHELQKLLESALRHDAETFTETRDEHAGNGKPGSTPRYDPIASFVACAVLTGMRLGEIVDLDWRSVDLEALDHEGRPVGEIYLSAATKTHKARTVGLEVSPMLRAMLAAMKLRGGGKGSVFGITRDGAIKAERRLRNEYGAPEGCNWQALRRTCGTYLTNAPGIFGAASAYRSARQLGHSVAIAERHYVGLIRGIPVDARDLESAMQIRPQLDRVIAAISERSARQSASKSA